MNRAESTRLSLLLRLRDQEDQLGWSEFHKRYGEMLFRYARRLGMSHGEAEDVVQEVEMYLLKAMDGFEHRERKGSFRAYLRSAVKHAVMRRADKRAKQEAALDPQTINTLARQDPREDPEWEREVRLHRVRWAMRSIAKEFEPVTLESFRLYVLANRPVGETAEQLGVSRDSVYQAKSRILKRLKERIDSLDSDMEVDSG